MFDFLDKFKEDKEISENLFNKLFGQKTQGQTQAQQPVTPAQTGQTQQSTQTAQTNTRKPQKTPQLQFERGKVYDFDLTRIPILGKFSNPITNLSFKSPEDFKAFKAIMFYLNAGYFDNDIHNLQRAIKYNEVDGFGQFPYLSSIFNNNKGSLLEANTFSKPKFIMPTGSKLPPKKQKIEPQYSSEDFGTLDSMRRLEKFVKYFVENLVDISGNPNKVQKSSIISRLKKLLGTNVQSPKKIAPVAQSSIEPGAKPEDIEKSGEDAKNYALKGLKEGIKQKVRSILKDNF